MTKPTEGHTMIRALEDSMTRDLLPQVAMEDMEEVMEVVVFNFPAFVLLLLLLLL